MNWFEWIQFGISLAAQILPLIKAVESAVGKGNGEKKKELVTGLVLASVHDTDKELVPVAERLLPGMIDATVNTMNASGVFQKGEAK